MLTGSNYRSNAGSNFRTKVLNRNRNTNISSKPQPTSRIVTENVFYLEDMPSEKVFYLEDIMKKEVAVNQKLLETR